MRYLEIDNYIIKTPILDILYRIKASISNGKLRDIIPRGSEIRITCPVHKNGLESTPAADIYLGNDTNIPYGYFNCFVCGAKGRFEKFVAECFNSTVDYAKEWLIKHYGEQKENNLPSFDEDIQVGVKKTKNYLSKKELGSYLDWNSYLAYRKLSRELCEKFNVKYDPKYRQVIFPVYDRHGNLLMLAKRSIDTKTFYLDKNITKPLYCLDKIINYDFKKFMIVEGPIDCLTCYMHDIPAVATLGMITKEQVNQLNKICPKVIYIATDNDEVGNKLAKYLEDNLDKHILTVRIELPKDKKDVNDLSEEEWQKIIEKYSLPIAKF